MYIPIHGILLCTGCIAGGISHIAAQKRTMPEDKDISSISLLRSKQDPDAESRPQNPQDRERDPEPNQSETSEPKEEASPISTNALENEMKQVLDLLWSFKEVLIEFKAVLEKDCKKSINELSTHFEEITRNIDKFHEDLRLKDDTREKISSVKGIGRDLAGAIQTIAQSASRDELYLTIADKITPLIETYSDVIEKVSLLESNLETFFRNQKTAEERKKHRREQALLPGSSAIIRSQEIERQRIAREIHDGPAQAIANVIFRLDIVQKMMTQKPDAIPDEMTKVKEIAQGALNEIRHFIFDLRPMTLQDLGLTATLRRIIQHNPGASDTKVELMIEGEERELDPSIDLAIFRIAQESLNNIKRHAKADNAWIHLKYFDDKVVLIVEDNGVGFDIKKKKERNIDEYSSFGLLGMQERAGDIGASPHAAKS